MHFTLVSHVGELSGQNRCSSGTRNLESNTHGLCARCLNLLSKQPCLLLKWKQNLVKMVAAGTFKMETVP
jgi:hypothetical protein